MPSADTLLLIERANVLRAGLAEISATLPQYVVGIGLKECLAELHALLGSVYGVLCAALEPCRILRLPSDAQLRILFFCDSAELCRLQATSRAFLSLVDRSEPAVALARYYTTAQLHYCTTTRLPHY